MKIDKIIFKAVKDIKVGDALDLEGDIYADPNRNNDCYEYHYVQVDDIIVESSNCIFIVTEMGGVGYPPEHKVKVEAEKRNKDRVRLNQISALIYDLVDTCQAGRKILDNTIVPMGSQKHGTPINDVIVRMDEQLEREKKLGFGPKE